MHKIQAMLTYRCRMLLRELYLFGNGGAGGGLNRHCTHATSLAVRSFSLSTSATIRLIAVPGVTLISNPSKI